MSFLSVLVLVPASRSVFFPAAAPSDAPSTPADGQGAETVERDAAVFVDGLEGLAQASFQNHAGAAGLSLDEYEAELHIADDDDDLGDELDGPARKRKAKKDKRDRKDRKKQERDEMMRKIGTPAMQIAGDLADGWERWAKYVLLPLSRAFVRSADLPYARCPFAQCAVAHATLLGTRWPRLNLPVHPSPDHRCALLHQLGRRRPALTFANPLSSLDDSLQRPLLGLCLQ